MREQCVVFRKGTSLSMCWTEDSFAATFACLSGLWIGKNSRRRRMAVGVLPLLALCLLLPCLVVVASTVSVSTFVPSHGSYAGGTLVTVTGSGFLRTSTSLVRNDSTPRHRRPPCATLGHVSVSAFFFRRTPSRGIGRKFMMSVVVYRSPEYDSGLHWRLAVPGAGAVAIRVQTQTNPPLPSTLSWS